MYKGPYAFSEPETRALANFVHSLDNISMYLALHSYGQLLMYPYVSIPVVNKTSENSRTQLHFILQGHTTEPSWNYRNLVTSSKQDTRKKTS